MLAQRVRLQALTVTLVGEDRVQEMVRRRGQERAEVREVGAALLLEAGGEVVLHLPGERVQSVPPMDGMYDILVFLLLLICFSLLLCVIYFPFSSHHCASKSEKLN